MTTRSRRAASAAEWVTLTLSILIVGALVAVAVMEEQRRQETGGVGVRVTFAADRAEARDGSYYVPYTVRNSGAQAIVSAEIWIEVFAAERLVESTEVTVEFLPLQGTQEAVYVTTADPATHEFAARLESLQFP